MREVGDRQREVTTIILTESGARIVENNVCVIPLSEPGY